MFKDTRQALRWAFRQRARVIIKPPEINRMYGNRRGSSDNEILMGLTPEDVHRQATNIVGIVDSMAAADTTFDEILYGVYGYEYHRERMSNLLRVCKSSLTGAPDENGVLHIVQTYCGKRTNLQEIRDALGVGMGTVKGYRDVIYKTLDSVHDKAITNIDVVLKDKGIVENHNNFSQGRQS